MEETPKVLPRPPPHRAHQQLVGRFLPLPQAGAVAKVQGREHFDVQLEVFADVGPRFG